MYIPYEEFFNIISNFLPQGLKKDALKLGNDLKVKQNLKYIKKNKAAVIKKLNQKIKNNKLNIVFYIYDETKWKAQSLYDLAEKSEKFIPYIFVSKNYSDEKNMNYQTEEDVQRVYDFFKNKNMRVFKAYKDKNFIPFDKMPVLPDIVIYSHPWYIYKTQGPVMVSKYALTGYIPYCLPTSVSPIEYYTRFHKYIENFYVLNDLIKSYYSKYMENFGVNLKAFGHTMLDYFYLNKNNKFENKGYIIYAPHWSVDGDNNLHWGTFLENGRLILEFAKKHSELNWVYKPHPCFNSYIKKYFTENEIKNYEAQWQKIALIHKSGDYLDLFMQSDAIITDCGSFQTEYFLTGKPFIYLKSENPTPFNPLVEKINDTYYKSENNEELEKLLNEVIINKNDYKKRNRETLYNQLNLENNYAAENILFDLENMVNFKEEL